MQSLRLPPSDPTGDIVKTRFTEFLNNFKVDEDEESFTVQQRYVLHVPAFYFDSASQ